MGSLSYTVGPWTVSSNENDTITTPKTLQLPDLSFEHDFSVASNTGKECRVINTTGGSLEPIEKLRYAKERVNDIYRNVDVPKANQLPSAAGVRILAETIDVLDASNGTTGAEYDIPIRWWTCGESTTHNAITGEALLWSLARHYASMLGTGEVDESMLIKLFRGDLDPTK